MKVALITGGSRGIGAATVDAFKEAGYKVATCSRSESSLKESNADFKQACDVGDPVAVRSLVSAAVSSLGKINVLVNNAGVIAKRDVMAEPDDEMWREVIRVNLDGTYFISKAVLPHMEPKQGRIINISSVLGLKGVPHTTAYCAAKHGVVGFTRSLALSVASKGITVNAVCPGWVRTEMGVERIAALGFDEATIKRTVPTGRIVEAKEVAAFILFLASPEAASITGQALTIDGGILSSV